VSQTPGTNGQEPSGGSSKGAGCIIPLVVVLVLVIGAIVVFNAITGPG
jgi:hypothetical protein